jgi:hypothetical protein
MYVRTMAPSRAFTLFFAGVLCTSLPGWAAGQRLSDHQPSGVTYRTPGDSRLELTARVPLPNRVPWSRRDIALASGFVAALLIDAAQTRRIARTGWRDFQESNVITGPTPGVGQIDTYTALSGLTILGVAAAAPPRVRPWVLGTALAVEVVALAVMSRQGVAIRIL